MAERIFTTVVLILISLLASLGISMLQGLFLSTPPVGRLVYSATMGTIVT